MRTFRLPSVFVMILVALAVLSAAAVTVEPAVARPFQGAVP